MLHSLFQQFKIESKIKHLKKNDEVFRLGQETESIYHVITGQVQLFRDDINGHRITLHQAFSGQFFAEASINIKHYHCTAQCINDTELHVINIRYFNRLLKSNAAFSDAWIKHLSAELRRQRASVERLNLKTAVEKITHFIMTEGNERGELILNSSLSDLAQIIGLSRESLYRTLSKMKKNNQIEQGKYFLRIPV